MSRTVMIVDDSPYMRKSLRGILVEKGYIVASEAASGIETMKNLHTCHPDIIMLGLSLLEWITKTRPNAKVVICSSSGQPSVIQKALDLGAKAFLQKPFTSEKVAEVLESLGD
jgi:two-component system chemotaxis response regulator CheY